MWRELLLCLMLLLNTSCDQTDDHSEYTLIPGKPALGSTEFLSFNPALSSLQPINFVQSQQVNQSDSLVTTMSGSDRLYFLHQKQGLIVINTSYVDSPSVTKRLYLGGESVFAATYANQHMIVVGNYGQAELEQGIVAPPEQSVKITDIDISNGYHTAVVFDFPGKAIQARVVQDSLFVLYIDAMNRVQLLSINLADLETIHSTILLDDADAYYNHWWLEDILVVLLDNDQDNNQILVVDNLAVNPHLNAPFSVRGQWPLVPLMDGDQQSFVTVTQIEGSGIDFHAITFSDMHLRSVNNTASNVNDLIQSQGHLVALFNNSIWAAPVDGLTDYHTINVDHAWNIQDFDHEGFAIVSGDDALYARYFSLSADAFVQTKTLFLQASSSEIFDVNTWYKNSNFIVSVKQQDNDHIYISTNGSEISSYSNWKNNIDTWLAMEMGRWYAIDSDEVFVLEPLAELKQISAITWRNIATDLIALSDNNSKCLRTAAADDQIMLDVIPCTEKLNSNFENRIIFSGDRYRIVKSDAIVYVFYGDETNSYAAAVDYTDVDNPVIFSQGIIDFDMTYEKVTHVNWWQGWGGELIPISEQQVLYQPYRSHEQLEWLSMPLHEEVYVVTFTQTSPEVVTHKLTFPALKLHMDDTSLLYTTITEVLDEGNILRFALQSVHVTDWKQQYSINVPGLIIESSNPNKVIALDYYATEFGRLGQNFHMISLQDETMYLESTIDLDIGVIGQVLSLDNGYVLMSLATVQGGQSSVKVITHDDARYPVLHCNFELGGSASILHASPDDISIAWQSMEYITSIFIDTWYCPQAVISSFGDSQQALQIGSLLHFANNQGGIVTLDLNDRDFRMY